MSVPPHRAIARPHEVLDVVLETGGVVEELLDVGRVVLSSAEVSSRPHFPHVSKTHLLVVVLLTVLMVLKVVNWVTGTVTTRVSVTTESGSRIVLSASTLGGAQRPAELAHCH